MGNHHSAAALHGGAVDYGGDRQTTAEGLPPSWWVYFAVVAFSLAAQAVSTVAMAHWGYMSCGRRFRGRGARTVSEPVAAVVPCYLPNEASIIEGTIRHLLTQLAHVDVLDVYVVYNTPIDLEIEKSLAAAAERCQPPGRRLFVQRVPGSSSKADNLNYVIPQISAKYIVIYDADHHPDPDSLALAVGYLEDTGVDCVQGSTYIREGGFLLRLFIHAEFFVTYFVVLPLMRRIAGTGFFGGANGIWRTASLQRLSFDKGVLTEDIDYFVRSIMRHDFSFDFLPECRSGELAPAGFGALWKQRLRWAMGWDEVTLRHAPTFWDAALTRHKRLGLYYIFVCRWVTQFCAVVIILFNATSSLEALLFRHPNVGSTGGDTVGEAAPTAAALEQQTPACVLRLQLASFYLYFGMIAFVFLQAALYEPRARMIAGLCMYFLIMPLWVVFQSVVLLVSLVRIASGYHGTWVVTARASAPPISATSANGAGDKPGSAATTPLLGRRTSTLACWPPNAACWFMVFGFVVIGAGCGAIIGAVLGRHRVVHPLWGWVPFSIGATTEEVIDGQDVALGFAAGACAGLFMPLLLFLIARSVSDDDAAAEGAG